MSASLTHTQGDAIGGSPIRAILLREFRAALLNRYVQVASPLALVGGIAAVMVGEDPGALAFILLQVSIYFVSLFAVLAGVSSARAESEEWPILLSQPTPRWTVVVGKFLAVMVIFAGILVLLFLPGLLTGPAAGRLAFQYVQTLGFAAVFGSLGLCVGFLSGDRVQGLVFAATTWLFLLFGSGVIALLLAQSPSLQKLPDLWVLLLMVNPPDAFRIQALFAFEQIPPESASKTPLALWWLTNASAWSLAICGAWIAALLATSTWRLARYDI